VTCQALMAVSKKITDFLHVMMCSLVHVYLRFGGTYCLYFRGNRVSLILYREHGASLLFYAEDVSITSLRTVYKHLSDYKT
jgi:hypothetical protein